MFIGNQLLAKSKATVTIPDHIIGVKISDSQMAWSTDGFTTYTTRNSTIGLVDRVQGNGKSFLAYRDGPNNAAATWFFTVDYGQNWKSVSAPYDAGYSFSSWDFVSSDSGQYLSIGGHNQSGTTSWSKQSVDYGDTWAYTPTAYMHQSNWGQGTTVMDASGQYIHLSQRSDNNIINTNYADINSWANITPIDNGGAGHASISPNGQYVASTTSIWSPYYFWYSRNYVNGTWTSQSAGTNSSYRPYYPLVTNSGHMSWWHSGYNYLYIWNGSTMVRASQDHIGRLTDDVESYWASVDSLDSARLYVETIATDIYLNSWLYGTSVLREGGVFFIIDSAANLYKTVNGGQSFSQITTGPTLSTTSRLSMAQFGMVKS